MERAIGRCNDRWLPSFFGQCGRQVTHDVGDRWIKALKDPSGCEAKGKSGLEETARMQERQIEHLERDLASAEKRITELEGAAL